jgi:3-hydroxyacyl-CoA dehydrogenase
VQRLVEMVPTQLASPAVVERTAAFAEQRLGKTVVRARDRSGFVVNALLVPYLLSAVRMLESGFASAEDIGGGMILGCAHPMGPLRLLDLIGLDTAPAIADSMSRSSRDRCTPHRRYCAEWSRPAPSAERPGGASIATDRNGAEGRTATGTDPRPARR